MNENIYSTDSGANIIFLELRFIAYELQKSRAPPHGLTSSSFHRAEIVSLYVDTETAGYLRVGPTRACHLFIRDGILMLPSSVGTDTYVGILHFCSLSRSGYRRRRGRRRTGETRSHHVYVEAVELQVRTTRVESVSTFVRVAPPDIFKDRRRQLHLKDINCHNVICYRS